jgi:predicted Zn-dependent protease
VLTPLSPRWKGYYYDGRSASRQPVIVTVMRDGVQIRREDATTLWWPFDQVRQTQGFIPGEQVRLERGGDLPEAIVVADPAFLSAIHQIAPQTRARFHAPARRWTRRLLVLSAVAGAIVLGSAIYLWGIPAFANAVASRIPVSWEEQLGRQVVEELTAMSRRCTDPERLKVLDRIVSTLTAPSAPVPYTFRITVLADPTINALAAPGGHLVLFAGRLEKTKTPEQLAGVLAHEIQHVLQRHATEALFRDMSLRALIAALAGDTGGLASALEAAGTLGGLRYSRKDEAAADRDGMTMLQAARIDPAGMIDVFLVLKKEAVDVPRALTYLSNHPHTDDRIADLRRMAAQARYTPVPLLPEYPWAEMGKICEVRTPQ